MEDAADACIETKFYLLWVLSMALFLHGGFRWIISHRASVSSDMLGHCQAEVAASAADLSRRIMWALIQAGSQVKHWLRSFSDFDFAWIKKSSYDPFCQHLCGSHNLLWSGSGRHLGSGNVLAVCVPEIISDYACVYVPVELYWVCRKEGYSCLIKGSCSFRCSR